MGARVNRLHTIWMDGGYRGEDFMGITEGTVKFHITNILQKLGVSDRTQAVVTAFQRGIANL